MSFRNPTPIRLGMAATFEGHRLRVAGRVVMGMDDAGATYYWNEFNLANDAGQAVTLVYEETERGGEWRLFTLFEPECPLTVADAATKQVGDHLNLDGTNLRVTLVDESRVYYIEGRAPEGVEVGDVARYFNLEAGNKMQVVSWTGDEVECYRGVNLSRQVVAAAFGLPPATLSGSTSAFAARDYDAANSPASGWAGQLLMWGGIAIVVWLILAGNFSCRPGFRRHLPAKITAPAVTLSLGNTGQLDGKSYQLTGHLLMEMEQDGARFDCHEYHLRDTAGDQALLVCGLSPGKREWHLFIPVDPIERLTPVRAAAAQVGQVVNINGYVVPVTAIFRCTIQQVESVGSPEGVSGAISYGFIARSDQNIVLVRWDDSGIAFYRSPTVPIAQVTEAFGAKASR